MVAVTLELAGEKATRKAGTILGALLRGQPIGKTAFVLALEGELGAGKTTFVRGLAKGLGIRDKITSPSFLIAKQYRIPVSQSISQSGDRLISQSANQLADHRRARNRLTDSLIHRFTNLWHFDFYRFEHPKRRDLALFNFSDTLRDPRNIVAIEWAEKVVGFLPREKLTLRLNVVSPTRRHIAMGNAQCLISN